MHRPSATHPWLRRAFAAALGLLAAAAHAQLLRVPSVSLPALPREPLAPVQQTLQQVAPLQDVRTLATRELIRRYPQAVEADPAGQAIRRAELLWLSPAPAAVEAARAEGFVLLREEDLPELEVREVVMRAPEGLATAQAAQRLRALDPQATVDFNHLYTRSGEVAPGSAAAPVAAPDATAMRVGLIDGGIDRRHAALQRADVQPWGCDGRAVASEHGTAIASLLVGGDRPFRGMQPGATLYAADVYCGEPAGGAAADVARALAWMARLRVPVINVSLVGPANRLLERATAAMVRRGHIVVAAVGNDGPAAAPLYPAAYPGVVGVTGVTPDRRALPEAAQGPQVTFAAPGSDVAVARAGGGYANARGTSFAAPFVAGLLARSLREPDPGAASRAIAQLARTALDLGEAGRDPVFGFGLVAESARIAPQDVLARDR